MKVVGSFWNFHLSDFHKTSNNGENHTMPDQARFVDELVSDIRKGIVPPEFNGTFSSSDDDDIWNDIDVDSMDIAELDELYRDAIDRLDYIEKYVRPQVNKRYSGPNLRQNDVSTLLPSNEDELHESE